MLECNWPIIETFAVVQSQMRREGLRYEGVEAGLRMSGIECTPELFGGLQVMEGAVLEYLAERHSG